jgi:hypothetical protein
MKRKLTNYWANFSSTTTLNKAGSTGVLNQMENKNFTICLNEETIGGLNGYFYNIDMICEKYWYWLIYVFIEFIISGNTSYTYWFVFISPLSLMVKKNPSQFIWSGFSLNKVLLFQGCLLDLHCIHFLEDSSDPF